MSVAVALALAASAPAVGKPRSLIPQPGATPKQAAPDSATPPPASTGSTPEAPADEAAEPGAAPIQVGDLKALDSSAVGLLHAENGGLGVNMWAGSSRQLVEVLLPHLPVSTISPAMRDLSRRLLLTAAHVPEGEPTSALGGVSLLAMRVERLAASGDTQSLAKLLRASAHHFEDPVHARIEIDAHWLSGDNTVACGIADKMVTSDQDRYWLQSTTFCRILEQANEQAILAADLLYEEGLDDPAFFSLVRILTGDEDEKLTSLPDPKALHLAMLRFAKRPIPDDAASSERPDILRVIAGSTNAGLALRLAAAERAEVFGAISPETLAQIYAGVGFTPEERATAISTAAAEPGGRANALLYQMAQTESVPAARAEALAAVWQMTRNGASYFTAARANIAATQALSPSPDLLWAAADQGRALLASGDGARARAWFEQARLQASAANTDAVAAVIQLWPLVQVAGGEAKIPWDPAVAGHWWDATVDLPAEQRVARATLLFMLLQALGHDVPKPLWLPLHQAAALAGPTDRAMAAPALRGGLIDAAADMRIGETVLFALLVLGPQGPAASDPVTLATVVDALRHVGLDTEARQIALEALMANGF
jgi:hypothetical protein